MTHSQNTVVNFKDVPASPALRTFTEDHCHQLAEEFPEKLRFEITIAMDGDGFAAHGHVKGGSIDVDANHAGEDEAGKAVDQLLDKLHAQLRKHHDKKIFKNRRLARSAPAKKNLDLS